METDKVLVFTLDDLRYAVSLDAVVRVVRLVEVTPLPRAPEIVSGAINVAGEIIPVIDIRRRFRLPKRSPQLNDHIVIARTSRRTVALVVDSTQSVLNRSDIRAVDASSVCPRLDYLDGVLILNDGLVLIHDLDTFLSLDEENELERAMKQIH